MPPECAPASARPGESSPPAARRIPDSPVQASQWRQRRRTGLQRNFVQSFAVEEEEEVVVVGAVAAVNFAAAAEGSTDRLAEGCTGSGLMRMWRWW